MGFGSFIPNKVPNKTVIRVLDLMRRIGRSFHIAWRTSSRHINDNRIAIDRLLGSFGEHKAGAYRALPYLEDQNKYASISYGRSDMAYAGCEVIAVYNALLDLGDRADLHKLIQEFEHDGMVLSGRFGTAPGAIRDCLVKRGYGVCTEAKPDRFDEAADASDVVILMLYNDRRSIFRKIHTICITRDDLGYTAHNTYGDGRPIGPFDTVTELIGSINEGYAKGIVLFGISKQS